MPRRISIQVHGGKRQSAAIAISVGAIVMITVTTIALLLSWSTSRVDAIASERQVQLLSLVLTDSVRAVARDQEASTVWDDAVKQLHRRPLDMAWLDNNLGIWFGTLPPRRGLHRRRRQPCDLRDARWPTR